jgi:two-component system NtrC family sensor kinase
LEQRVAERTAELERQQEALAQREKLAAMGSLLASVAHELNNPLAAVMAQADLLCEELGPHPLREQAAEIIQAAERCVGIVRNFLTLAHQHSPQRTRVEFNALISEAMKLLSYPLQVDTIEVRQHLANDLPPLWADPNQLHQVIVNLITNAHQALRETTEPRRLTLRTRAEPNPERVLFEVADTGPGIPSAVQARIFEPFFTTKPSGVGTGLGLPFCRGIVEEHGGVLSVESQPGQGAVFRVELPVRAIPPQFEAVAEPETPEASDGKTILIVDDEAGIRRPLARLLRRDGYGVETASNGRAALEKCQDQTFDLILSDLRMPELDGPGFYRELVGRFPHLGQRVLFLTGDTLSPEVDAFLADIGAPRLTKPFTAALARRTIRQMLTRHLSEDYWPRP